MTVELRALTTSLHPIVAAPSGRCSPLLFYFFNLYFFFLQQRMSVRMDNFSATTKGVYLPSGGATTMTTAQTTVMKKTVVSGGINAKQGPVTVKET